MFVNRVRELAFLEKRFASGQAEMVVLYGRRRVGKTELLRRFCEGKRCFFYVADLGTEASTLAEMSRRYGAIFHNDPESTHFATWDQAFKALARQAGEERLIVVLDEFTYLLQTSPALPSILQRLWDETLQHTNIMLILSGSYVGIMEREVLAYRAPLYGRRSGQWHLQPLSFADARLFLPGYSLFDQVRAYAILGGVPAYLRQFSDRRPLLDNIEEEILSQGAFLYDEPRFLLQMELREPRVYFAILEAIATGHLRQGEISQAVGVKGASLGYYLNTLRELGLIDRMAPITDTDALSSRQGRYHLNDPFFRFWFRFAYRERVHLEQGETGTVRLLIDDQLDALAGRAFEDICRSRVLDLSAANRIPFRPRRVGMWWDSQTQIDVAALDDEYILLAECRWRSRPIGPDVLAELKRKTGRVPGGRHQVLALFSRAGFTTALQKEATSQGVLLFGQEDVLGSSPPPSPP
ncbi:MAG: ATP-binding protein [Caldilineales bacterium]|nr:ATP-binding protein [Caldilineales bacterium]MCW5857995.1 ATP-binding protein [Caldilineales bacterium]